MDEMRKLLKLAAYAKAPKTTFAILHPIRALKWGAAFYVGKKIWEKARQASERVAGEDVPSVH
jgi:hypothetical protein